MGAIRAVAAVLVILISAAASAADCVTDVRVLSTRASVPNLVNGPSVWTGTGLAVAKSQDGAIGPVWVAVYGDGMETLAGDRQVAGDARELISLVWTGVELGLFYRTTNSGFHLQRLSPMGVPIGSPVAITPSRPVFKGDRIQVVWSPFHDAYVVARYVTQSSLRGLYITMLEENGAQRSDRPILVTPASVSPLAMAVTPGGVIGAFFHTTNSTLALARMTGSTDTPEVWEVGAGGGALLVAAREERWVIVRTASDGGRLVIRWLIVNTAHQVVKSDSLLVERSGDALPQALVITPDELALSYVDSLLPAETLDDSFRLRRFSIAGTLIGDTPFAPTDLSALRSVTPHPFAWTGNAYLAATVRESTERLTSYLLRYCPLRVEILAPKKVLVGEIVTFVPEPTGGVPGYSYVWTFSHQAAPEKVTMSPQRTYTTPGTYSTTVTVTDNTGVSTTDTVTFEVGYPRRRAVRP
jgi:hypothetical protein